MKVLYIVTTVVLALTLTASVAYCEQELAQQYGSDSGVRLVRVKRKGKSRGGIFGKSKSKPKSGSRVPPADPYPKQPGYNPSYNPYPKQPGGSYPGQTGHNYPGQTGHFPQGGYGSPGQHGNYPGNYGQNYGKTGTMGGLGGLGGMGMGKSKGMGGLGTGLAGGAIGAAVGAYGGYKLGKMVGGLGRMGHYGYYDDRRVFVRCDPPPRIETDPTTNITYIPRTVTYDARCDYYDREPPRRHPYYYTNDSGRTAPSVLVSAFVTVMAVVLALDLHHWPRARPWSWLVVS